MNHNNTLLVFDEGKRRDIKTLLLIIVKELHRPLGEQTTTHSRQNDSVIFPPSASQFFVHFICWSV